MAHQTNHKRILAAVPDPQIQMDPPTSRKPKPKPNPAAVSNHRRRYPPPISHPLPDPTVPSSTIQSISHRFSKLYINHKKVVSTHPQPDPHPHPSSFSPFLDSSCTTLTKCSSQHGRTGGIGIIPVEEKFVDKNHTTKIKNGDLKKKSCFDEEDVKKGLKLMEGEEKTKGFQEGGRNSLSSIPPTMVNRGRRRSFCTSQQELADFFSCSGVKVVAVDMPPFMQIHAVNCARKAHDSLEKFTSKILAFTLKKEFDGVYGPAWHCIVGTSFGSFVTHSVGGFMYFSLDLKLYILLFKTAVQRAE